MEGEFLLHVGGNKGRKVAVGGKEILWGVFSSPFCRKIKYLIIIMNERE